MNRSMMILLVICVAAVIVIIPMSTMNSSMFQNKAEQAITSGNFKLAMSIYTDALLREYPAREIPPFERAIFIMPKKMFKMTKLYFTSVTSLPKKTDMQFIKLLSKIEHCNSRVLPFIKLEKIAESPLSLTQLGEIWRHSLYIPAQTNNMDFAMVRYSFTNAISIIQITSTSNNSCELFMMNTKNPNITSTLLTPGQTIFILGASGKNIILTRNTEISGSTRNPSSEFTMHTLELPSAASLLQFEMK